MILQQTKRLLFRSHSAEDEDDFVRMQMDPEVRRYVGGQGWPLEKARDRFRKQYLGRPTRTYGLWATVLKEEERYVGCCGLRPGPEKSAHLGYYFARPYWGQGFASETSLAFIQLAFNGLSLLRLLADVEEGNAASKHILVKFGFKCLSREEIAESGRVLLLYELTRTDWAPRNR